MPNFSGNDQMNLATPLPVKTTFADLLNQNPTAALFECMEQGYGDACTPLKVKRNTLLFNQGARLSCLFMIQEGEILLNRLSQDGRETLISILGPGEFFGEGALLSGSVVAFSAKAAKQSVLLQLPERKFKSILENPQVCRMMLESATRRCDEAWTQMEVLGCTHVRDKVRSGLLWLSERIGVETHQGVRIDMNLTQMARMVGCARETLSREVSELKRLRAVDVRHANGRMAFFVMNPKGLG
jgi:CRP/FNR family transcriptional regulator, cyclic AMP receptor protein